MGIVIYQRHASCEHFAQKDRSESDKQSHRHPRHQAGPANIFASRSKLTLIPLPEPLGFALGDAPGSRTFSLAKPADRGEYVRSGVLDDGSGVVARLIGLLVLELRASMLFRTGVKDGEDGLLVVARLGLESDRVGVWYRFAGIHPGCSSVDANASRTAMLVELSRFRRGSAD